MPPAQADADRDAGRNKPFRREAANAVVVFETGAGDPRHDDKRENSKEKLRLAFKACYDPPVVTFRFNASVFSHGSGKKRQKTTLYFDVPRHHISSLEQTYHIDMTTVPELDRDVTPKLVGGITRIRFLLNRPGNLIQPMEELSLKPASHRTLQSMALLATVLNFVIFLPHTTLSKDQFQSLQQAITSPIAFDDQQKQEKEHDWWLAALYGGAGGKLSNNCAAIVNSPGIQRNDASTASESGDSTVATATPPAYKRLEVPDDHSPDFVGAGNRITASDLSDDVAATSPPPYQTLEYKNGEPDPSSQMPQKRLRESVQVDAKSSRRRLASEPSFTGDEQTHYKSVAGDLNIEKYQEANPHLSNVVAMFLLKFNEVLRKTQDLEEENGALKAELRVVRENQDQMNAELREMRGRNHAHVEKRIQDLEEKNVDLETQITDLGQCHDTIEERQVELEERQEKMEEKCDNIEVEIIDQVHAALKSRLIDALETM
ncbi:hypothetical protein SCUP234_12913 [Seiridium cupressi]